LNQSELDTIVKTILQVYGKTEILNNELESIVNLCLQDKKNEGKTILFSLLDQIGKCQYNIPASQKEIAEALSFYQSL